MRQIMEHYYVTEDGHIYSDKTKKLLSERCTYRGYLIVNLSIGGKCKTYPVHRLIAQAFIPNPSNLPTVNHKNGIKTDNTIENLEWVSYSENARHALRTGLATPAKGKSTKYGRFSDEDIIDIRELHRQGTSYNNIARMYNVTKSAIQQILNGRTYSYVK